MVMSHTPFQELSEFHNKNVLVVGGQAGKCRDVAKSYGFKNVLVPGDIWADKQEIWPFSQPFAHYYDGFTEPIGKNQGIKIDAIFVYNDPRDWGLDMAVIVDLLLSQEGRYGTLSPKNGDQSLPNKGYQQDGQPKLYFSNPDLWWANKYHLPRLGQGAFREALEGVWAAITGGPANGVELQREVIGKPYHATYDFAEKQLRRNMEIMARGKPVPPLRKVYMIGDNPESDIRGANNYRSPHGTDWVSVLVKSGVYTGGEPAHKPRAIMEDVYSAVRWALEDAKGLRKQND